MGELIREAKLQKGWCGFRMPYFRKFSNSKFKEINIEEAFSKLNNVEELDLEEAFGLVKRLLGSKNSDIVSKSMDFLMKFDDDKVISMLIELSKRRSILIKCEAIERMSLFPVNSVIQTLVKTIRDKNSLVRICSAESLGVIKAKEAVQVLREALLDEDRLARGYAAEALGQIGDKGSRELISEALRRERRNDAKVRYYYALYMLDNNDEYILKILQMFNSKSYQVRCAAANLLSDLINKDNLKLIKRRISLIYKKEKTPAVRYSLENLIGSIKLYDQREST
ncbi:MAG: hypothetical protein VR68_00175 [Peptococcaceae bacterium BRH_c4a]|nr:MAG: hypothetical protein VR68_00175 [Peptococcaceae bacterium BRH_c4a]